MASGGSVYAKKYSKIKGAPKGGSMQGCRCSQCGEEILSEPVVHDCRYFHDEACRELWVRRLLWIKGHPDAPAKENPWYDAVPMTSAA